MNALINLKANDEKYFKLGVNTALHHEDIKHHLDRISLLQYYKDKYNWQGLEFRLPVFLPFFFSTRLNTHIQFVQFKNTYNKRWRYSKIALHMETHTSYNTGGKTYLGKYLKKNYFQKYMVRSFDISSENAKIIDAVIKIMTKLTSTQMT